jgi:hypothetical protein
VFSTVTKTPQGQNYDKNTGDTDMISVLAKVSLWPTRTWDSLLERALYQAERLNDAAKRVRVVFTRVEGQSKPKPQYLGSWGAV